MRCVRPCPFASALILLQLATTSKQHACMRLHCSGMDVKGASFEGIADFEVEKETLFPVLAESRVVSGLTGFDRS